MKAKARIDLSSQLRGPKKQWYQSELATAALLSAVVNARRGDLSKDDLWNLLRLTWVTVHGQEVTRDHWRRLKVPALASLFRRPTVDGDDLRESITAMGLPKTVSDAAMEETGIVNLRGVWRNTILPWCGRHRTSLNRIVRRAQTLPANDQIRFDLAEEIEQLPSVPSPNNVAALRADKVLSPLVAALDPAKRFPIVNGRSAVQTLLGSRGLRHHTFQEQVRGLVGLVGQFGIEDAFVLDVLAEEVAGLPKDIDEPPSRVEAQQEHPVLKQFDEAERQAALASRTIRYRDRHDCMTNRLLEILSGLTIRMGHGRDDRFDALAEAYDSGGRDLLIEAKPDPDRGSVRIGVGQLLDYRRRLAHRARTDLALLTITPPNRSYREFLMDLQITSIWFTDERCSALEGEGKAWLPLKRHLRR